MDDLANDILRLAREMTGKVSSDEQFHFGRRAYHVGKLWGLMKKDRSIYETDVLTPSDLKTLIQILDPDEIPGRITLITRLGVDRIETVLPPLIESVLSLGRNVLWSCDPMHGNTETLISGIKTRRFENILKEMELCFDIHAASGSSLGGVHLELTGENVTECTGGAGGLQDEDLGRAYQSQVDPRLNGEQGLEMAFSIIRKKRRMAS